MLNHEDLCFEIAHHDCWELQLGSARHYCSELWLEAAYHQRKTDPRLRRNKTDSHVRDHLSPRHQLPLLLGCTFEVVIGPPWRLSIMGAQCGHRNVGELVDRMSLAQEWIGQWQVRLLVLMQEYYGVRQACLKMMVLMQADASWLLSQRVQERWFDLQW